MTEKLPILEVNNVSFSFGSTKVLSDISFHIEKGDFLAILGPNGSGKTTLIKLMMGIYTANSGRIKILNTQINIDDKEKLTNYVLEKLDLTKDQYSQIMLKKNKNFKDFKTYYNLFKYLKYPVLLANKLGFVPKILYLRYYGCRN